jgi:hypothetical protein
MIDANNTPAEETTDCYLVVSDTAVEDLNNVPYLGLEVGEHEFGIRDQVPPEIENVYPRNGHQTIPLGITLTFIFNEDIVPGTDNRIGLYRYGTEFAETFVELNTSSLSTLALPEATADHLTAAWELDEAAFQADKRSISVSLRDRLTYATVYSIGLAPGIVRDVNENSFRGLRAGTYVFQTATEEWYANANSRDSDSSNSYDWIYPAIIIALITAALMWIFFLAYYLFSRRQNQLDAKVEQGGCLDKVPQAWEGEVHGQKVVDDGNVIMVVHAESGPPPSPRAETPNSPPRHRLIAGGGVDTVVVTASPRVEPPGAPIGAPPGSPKSSPRHRLGSVVDIWNAPSKVEPPGVILRPTSPNPRPELRPASPNPKVSPRPETQSSTAFGRAIDTGIDYHSPGPTGLATSPRMFSKQGSLSVSKHDKMISKPDRNKMVSKPG